jgi:branched-chain amino acid aminotransferase
VSEGSAMNIFMVRDGVVITPPVTENILEGITRRSVIVFVREELDLPVVERPIDRTEVYLCNEFFMTGTAAQITAVTQVDHRPVGSGVMGPVTEQLRNLFLDVVHGRNPRYLDWVTPVYEKALAKSQP